MLFIIIVVEEATNAMLINAKLMAKVNQFMLKWEFVISSLKEFK
jgi:hypothetical protein